MSFYVINISKFKSVFASAVDLATALFGKTGKPVGPEVKRRRGLTSLFIVSTVSLGRHGNPPM